MSFLTVNYGNWTFWESYNENNFTYGTQKVTFDGPNKLILINEGETDIDVKVDIYSAWKEWTRIPFYNNLLYDVSMSSVGGDPITDTEFLGSTFFLENGWRIKPYAGNYILTIAGNLYTREVGENPVVPTEGVSVSLTRSNVVDGRVAITQNDYDKIAYEVWEESRELHYTPNTFGEGVASVQGDIVGNIQGDVLNPSTISSKVWDEVLNENTHNITDSAGKRMWTIQEYGGYEGGSVWLDSTNGTAGVISNINGTVGLPSSNLENALTIAGNNNIKQIFINEGTNINLTSFTTSVSGYRFWGNRWTIELGEQDISNTTIENSEITGIGEVTGDDKPRIISCILNNARTGPAEFNNCGLINEFTINSAGDFIFDNCFTAGPNDGLVLLQMNQIVGQTNVYFSHFSGSLSINSMRDDDYVVVEGEGKLTIEPSCLAGVVSIRGDIEITDNSNGAVTVNSNSVVSKTDIAESVWDRILDNTTHNDVNSAGRRLREIQDNNLSTVESKIDNIDITVNDNNVDISAIDTRINTIEGKIDTIDTVVDDTNADLQTLTSNVSTGFSNVDTDLTSIAGNIQDIETTLDTDDPDTIDSKLATLTADLVTIQGQNNTIISKVDDVDSDLINVATTVNNIESSVAGTGGTGVNAKLDSLSADLLSVSAQNNTITSKVDGVDVKVDTIDSIVDKIDLDMVSVTAELFVSDATTTDQKLDSIINKVDDLDTDVAAVYTEVNGLALGQGSSELATLFEAVTADIVSITGTLDSYNVATIRSIVDDINTNTVNLNSDLSTLSSVVSGIDTDTDDLISKSDNISTKIDDNYLAIQNVDNDVANIAADLGTNSTQVNDIAVDVTQLKNDVRKMLQTQAGRWKVDKANNTLTIYDEDDTTPLFQFLLRDDKGEETYTSVFERFPV
jgi:hypothetical protein